MPSDKSNNEPVELGELENSLGFLLRLAQVKVFEAFYQQMQMPEIRPGEFTVLWVISLNPGLRQGSIARKLSIKPAHMTRLIQRMVNAGYVERLIPPDDRRSIQLSLTRQGKKVVSQHKANLLQLHETERANLTEREVKQMTSLLKKFTSQSKG